MADRAERPDIVVPEEAAGRGPFLRGKLCKDQLYCPDVLAQFEQIAPYSRFHAFLLSVVPTDVQRALGEFREIVDDLLVYPSGFGFYALIEND